MSPIDGARQEPSGSDAYRELFERSADAILIIEGDRFVDCNQATVEMLRLPDKAAVLRTHPSELSPPVQPDGRDSFEKANEIMATAFREGSQRFEWAHVRADGEVFPVEVLLTAVGEGGQRKLHVVWRDISERKRLEDQLRHSQKMEALGKLAGGVAHDFNNLLVPILGNCDLALADVGDNEAAAAEIRSIQRAGERAAQLVKQLLAFSRKQELQARVIVLNEALDELGLLLRRLIGEDIALRIVSPENAIRVKADVGQIEQVVINLVTNARDAMPDGGELHIELRELEIDEESAGQLVKDLPAGRYAVLSVRDSGVGMDEATKRRAFEPFFTTKDVGAGTGLGLATVYGIAQQSRGAARIDTSPGVGTVVRVYLPVADEDSRELYGSRELPSRGGSESILVAEDEPAVADLVTNVLRSKGYRVSVARDGSEAWRMWNERGGAVDLLLTDVVMPNMGGPELVRRLRAAGENPRVLYVSGYTRSAVSSLESTEDDLDLLEKPYSTRELVGRVRLALDRDHGHQGIQDA